MESGRFLPIKVGEGGSHFGNDDLFFFLCNRFSERAAVENAFLFLWRRGDWFLGEHILISWRAGSQFRLVKSPIGKGGIRAKSRPSTGVEGRSGVLGLTHCLGPAGFRVGPHQGPWAGQVG